jgi:hypothetical protein
MSRARFALIVIVLLMVAFSFLHTVGVSSAQVPAAAPALQATPAPTAAPTPPPSSVPQAEAPLDEGTQQVLLILGLSILSVALIGGGIYLRRRWIATRY